MSMNFMKKICLGSLSFAMMAGIFACSGENGVDGRDGRDGKDGVDGKDGSDGRDGKDGVAGKNGEDGESTTDTLYVVKKDTVIFAGDTIYISKKDTLVLKDTVYVVNDKSSSSSKGVSSSSKTGADAKSSSSAGASAESSNSSEAGSGACTAQVYESDYHKVLVDCGNYSFIAENVKEQPAAKWGEDLVDERGGNSQTYKTVIIGEQTWMAENLNYAVNAGEQSWCYNDEASNCTTYGRLYTWAAAVGKSEDECGYEHACSLPSGNIQGVCPEGWHLPSRAEWTTLENFVDAHNGTVGVGTDLKSLTGWSSGNGNDLFAFSALPAGYRLGNGDFRGGGYDAYFWSSTESDGNSAYGCNLYYDGDYFGWSNYYDKDNAFSVRCLKDS